MAVEEFMDIGHTVNSKNTRIVARKNDTLKARRGNGDPVPGALRKQLAVNSLNSQIFIKGLEKLFVAYLSVASFKVAP